MAKIENDKYYTSSDLAKYCVEKTKEIIGEQNITEYIEPSAGSGVFLDYLDKPYLAYDIEPEDDRIKKQDYLSLDLDYKKGRCIIGNPPFGKSNYISVKFFKKSILLADYISFIQPITQLNNNLYMYEFDMIHSEDLKLQYYSERKIHCCLNIYRRPTHGYNSKPNFELEDVKINTVARSTTRNDKIPENYDFSIVPYGSSVGKICEYEGQYCRQLYFVIKNKLFKDKVRDVIESADWKSMCKINSAPNISIWQIYKYLKEQIPELE